MIPLSDHRDLSSLLQPKSIALLGASDRSRWSANIFRNISRQSDRRVHLVNRRSSTAHGEATVKSCQEIGDTIDLGLIMLPKDAVRDSISELGEAGARNVIVLSSGYAETGTDGLLQQQDLLALTRSHGMTMLGPNSLGFANFLNGLQVWTGGLQEQPQAGSIAVVSQSGAIAGFIAGYARQQEILLSHLVSTGNEADLNCGSVATHLVNDDQVKVIGMFVEAIRSPGDFINAAQAALRLKKPLIILKTGRSELSARSAKAHTGALVGDDRLFDAICEQFGVIRVDSLEDMLFTADTIVKTGVLPSGGIGLVSASGGICGIGADYAHRFGVPLPPFEPAVTQALSSVMPDFGTAQNPLDLTGASVINRELFESCLKIVANQSSHALTACVYDVPSAESQKSESGMIALGYISAAFNDIQKPTLLISHTARDVSPLARDIVADLALPYVASGLELGMKALGQAWKWSKKQRNSNDEWKRPILQDHTIKPPAGENAIMTFLSGHGVPVVPSLIALTDEAAIRIAAAIGGPVVLKLASPDVEHKTEIGGVILNVQGDEAVKTAFHKIVSACPAGAKLDGVAISPMRPRGLELLVGYKRDPQWGSVLVVGMGGIFVETLNDVSLRLLPVDAAGVKDMLFALRSSKLLEGHRGVPAPDIDALAGVIVAIGSAAIQLGENLETLEVNPLWVHGSQIEALDALANWTETTDSPLQAQGNS